MGQGFVIGAIGWVLDLGCWRACALHYTIDARNNWGLLGRVMELVDYGGQWNRYGLQICFSSHSTVMLLNSACVVDVCLTAAKLSDQAPLQPRTSLEGKVVLRS